MNSLCDSKCHAIENQDEDVLDTSYREFVLGVSDAHHMDDKDQHSKTCMLYTEYEKPINDGVTSDNMLLPKEPCSSFPDQDYVGKIKEFQFYVDTVKKMVRPGCSQETLNVALSSISSLVKTLSVMSSKQHIHASL